MNKIIGDRLCEERERLGIKNQTEFAAIGGIQLNAQSAYENGLRLPKADYLANIALRGADVLYILTGQRSSPLCFPDDEVLLLNAYKKMQDGDKQALLRLVLLMAGHG
ncbi:MAG: helix-turn-helix transcriptional regulator [Moraxellaceae bacterium]|nr:helix-turn-helix transcriptional regulator [Moraxellaceae bacterium]